MKRIISAFIFLMMLAATATAQAPVEVAQNQQALLESDDPQLAANKKLVFDFWREVFQARNMDLAPQYMAEDYIQHNPNVPSGRQAFVNFFGQFEQRPVKDTIDDLVTIIAERDIVILAFKREYPDPQNEGETYTTTWFDMLRIEDGKLAEHWDYGTKSEN
ncbi:MAG: nuclear transport factor 2 family protein [Balneolaceae bacterium]|nr:nuclear transport factor 2 family protein [Balneolaceae bacterium]